MPTRSSSREGRSSLWGKRCLSYLHDDLFSLPMDHGIWLNDGQGTGLLWRNCNEPRTVLSAAGLTGRPVEALRRPSAGTTQPLHPGLPRLAPSCVPADLDSRGSTGLAPDLSLDCKGPNPWREGVGDEGGVRRRSKTAQERKPRNS